MSYVIGIDPSLTATGFANEHGDTFTVTYPKDCTGDLRLGSLWMQLEEALPIPASDVDLAVIEDLPTHAHGAGLTGMAQGIVRLLLIEFKIPYRVVSAATLKKFATGKGDATKADMRMALFQRAGLDIRDDNQVDAAWLREIGLHLLGEPSIQLPKTHTVALDKIRIGVSA